MHYSKNEWMKRLVECYFFQHLLLLLLLFCSHSSCSANIRAFFCNFVCKKYKKNNKCLSSVFYCRILRLPSDSWSHVTCFSLSFGLVFRNYSHRNVCMLFCFGFVSVSPSIELWRHMWVCSELRPDQVWLHLFNVVVTYVLLPVLMSSNNKQQQQ